MKVTTERLENCVVALDIQIDEKDTDNYLHGAAHTLSREYRVAGFRPGKAPYDVVVRRFGLDAIRTQAVDQFGDKLFEEGLKESGLQPIAQATLENVTWEPLTLHLKVPVAATVDLGAYRDIRVDWQAPQTTDEDLDDELARMQKQHADREKVEREAQLGDQVIVDITGEVEGKVVLGNTGREMVLNADSPYPVPGFAQQVVGMKSGETREFDLSYPADHYNPDTAGKLAHFKAVLHEIWTENMPALNDEFATLVGDYENLQDLKTKLRQSLQERAATQAKEEYREQIWVKLLEMAKIEYPLVYVERQIEVMKEQIEAQLKRNNMDMETYFKLTNTTEEEWKKEATPQAEERIKRRLVLDQVVEQEKIRVDKGELAAEIDRIVGTAGEQAASIREWLGTPDGAMALMESLLTDKALERLDAIAKGQAPSLEELGTAAAEPAAMESAPQAETVATEAATAEATEAVAEETAAVEPAAVEPADETPAGTAEPEPSKES